MTSLLIEPTQNGMRHVLRIAWRHVNDGNRALAAALRDLDTRAEALSIEALRARGTTDGR